MKIRLGLLSVFAVLAQGAGALLAQESNGIFPFEYETVRLDNGLKVYLIHAGAPGQVAYVSLVRTGARDEVEEGKTGFAHFFEHMMFRGTEKYPDYDGVTERMGAARNAGTNNDMTIYYLVAASEYLEQIIDLESDRFMNLDYDATGFRTEAGAVLGEYQNSASSPFAVLDRAVRETAYLEHTYRHQTIGFEADVRAMPEGFDYSHEFHRRFYRPDNVILVVTGDFDFADAENLIRRYYGSWTPGYEPSSIPTEPEQTTPRIETVNYSGRTLPILSFNWKAPAWDPSGRIAVATEVLGQVAFGSNSEIYRTLVIDEQRLQFMQTGFGLSRDPGLITINAMVTDPTDVDAVREEIMRAVEGARNELVDPTALANTKSRMKYQFLMDLETALDVNFSLADPIVFTGSLEAVDEYYRTLESVTEEDVRAAARRFLGDNGLTLVTLVQEEMGS